MNIATFLPRHLSPFCKNGQNIIIRRGFGTGSRGARGHGWYVKYRAGLGGRHLQGEYFDRESLEECQQWNEAILKLGSTQVFMDVVLEPKNKHEAFFMERPNYPHMARVPPVETLTGPKHRIYIDLASKLMPESSDNFIKLCNLETHGYKGSKLFRIEREVGICGGDVLSNTGKTGLAAPVEYSEEDKCNRLLETQDPLCRTILRDPLALWHIPGTVTMLVKRVHDVDSRFLLLTERAMHMDGIHRAIGQLRPESLGLVQEWKASTLTKDAGYPTTFNFIIADCGVVESDDEMATAA